MHRSIWRMGKYQKLFYSPINIVKSHDIIFPRIFTALYFYDNERIGSRVRKTMKISDGDMTSLVLAENPNLFDRPMLGISYIYRCHSGNHRPVLASSFVRLER